MSYFSLPYIRSAPSRSARAIALSLTVFILLALTGCSSMTPADQLTSARSTVSDQTADETAADSTEQTDPEPTGSGSSNSSETSGSQDELTASAIDQEEDKDATSANEQIKITSSSIPAAAPLDGLLVVHFIDVGQGDAILVQQGEASLLIDAGDNNKGRLVVDYLRRQGISRLDYIIATHPHADHIGGLDDVINAFSVGKIIMPDITHTTRTFEDFLLAIRDNNLRITRAVPGNSYALGDAQFEILGPVTLPANDLNHASVVSRLTFGTISFMFTGDAEASSETEILRSSADLRADVLKIAHHGSHTSTSAAFLQAVSPSHAVIMVGQDNRYNHPAQTILDRLAASDIKVYRTDLLGSIIAQTDGLVVDFNKDPRLGQAGGSTSPPATDPEMTTVTDAPEVTTTAPSDEISGAYIGNLNSKKFHLPTCRSLPYLENQIQFDSRGEAIDAGYDPCGICKP